MASPAVDDPEWYEVAICDDYLKGASVGDLATVSGLSTAEVIAVLKRGGAYTLVRWSCHCRSAGSKHVPSLCSTGYRVTPKAPPGSVELKALPGGMSAQDPPRSVETDVSDPMVPTAAARVARNAAAHGWSVRLVWAQGIPPRGRNVVTSLSVRMHRGNVGVVAFWESGRFTLGMCLTEDNRLVRMSAREVASSASS